MRRSSCWAACWGWRWDNSPSWPCRARACRTAEAQFKKAEAAVADAQRLPKAHLESIAAAKEAVLGPLNDLIASKKSAVESAEKEVARLLQSIRRMFLQAFGILVLVTFAPVGIKAVWYWLLAPIVEKRPPTWTGE